MPSRDIVIDAVTRLFGARDASAIDDYFGPVYRQHSALGADGLDGLRALLGRLPEAFGYEFVQVLGDGDLVVTLGLYRGFGPAPVAGFDVWRVDGERIVEHWDALGAMDASGLDGGIADRARTDANRDLVRDWVTRVLIGGETSSTAEFAVDGAPLAYRTLHQVIAEGDLVYTRSEGGEGQALILNDLVRVSDGRLVEHWALVSPVPVQLPHGNGSF